MRRLVMAGFVLVCLSKTAVGASPQDSLQMEKDLTAFKGTVRFNEFDRARPLAESILALRSADLQPPKAFLFFAAQTFLRTGDSARATRLLEEYLGSPSGSQAYEAASMFSQISLRAALPAMELFQTRDPYHADFYRLQSLARSVRAQIAQEDRLARLAREAAEARRRQGMLEDSLAAARCLAGGSTVCAQYLDRFSASGDWGEQGRWVDTAKKRLHQAYGQESSEMAHAHGFDQAIALLEQDQQRFPSPEARDRIGAVLCRAVGYYSGTRGHTCSDPTFETGDGDSRLGRQKMILAYGERYLSWKGPHVAWVEQQMEKARQIKRMEEMDLRYNLGVSYGHSWTGNETLYGLSLNYLVNRSSRSWGISYSMEGMLPHEMVFYEEGGSDRSSLATETGMVRRPLAKVTAGMTACVVPPLWLVFRAGMGAWRREVQWAQPDGTLVWDSEQSSGGTYAFVYSAGGILEFTRFHIPMSIEYTLFQVHRRGLYWTLGASYAI